MKTTEISEMLYFLEEMKDQMELLRDEAKIRIQNEALSVDGWQLTTFEQTRKFLNIPCMIQEIGAQMGWTLTEFVEAGVITGSVATLKKVLTARNIIGQWPEKVNPTIDLYASPVETGVKLMKAKV
jgi:hypothetical protein